MACGSGSKKVAPTTTTAPTTSTSTTLAPTTAPTEAPPPPTTTTTMTAAPLPAVGITPAGVVVPVLGRDGAAVKVATPCERSATVPSVTPVGPVDVVLDAGHGGRELGAVGPNGLTEAVLNMAVTNQAKAALEANGVRVALTRTSDYMVTLNTRGKLVTTLKPKAFVSIHHNAEPDGPFATPGTETYYQFTSPASKRLAGLIYEEVHKALSQYDVAWVADTDAGAKWRLGKSGSDYYAVLRQTKGVPAALAELAYITDATEADLLSRPDVQEVEGVAVARGIVRFLRSNDPGSGFTTPYPRTEPAGGGGGATGCIDPALV